MRIIEVALSSEYELDDIIRNGIISEDETTMFYNFRRKDGITRTCGMQLNKFVLLESMKGLYKRISVMNIPIDIHLLYLRLHSIIILIVL